MKDEEVEHVARVQVLIMEQNMFINSVFVKQSKVFTQFMSFPYLRTSVLLLLIFHPQSPDVVLIFIRMQNTLFHIFIHPLFCLFIHLSVCLSVLRQFHTFFQSETSPTECNLVFPLSITIFPRFLKVIQQQRTSSSLFSRHFYGTKINISKRNVRNCVEL